VEEDSWLAWEHNQVVGERSQERGFPSCKCREKEVGVEPPIARGFAVG